MNYYIWLISIVGNVPESDLLQYLFNIDYVWTFPMDEKRSQDGIDLRYIFANTYGLDQKAYDDMFGNRPCTMLEMLVAFANRIENEFMATPNNNTTGLWFNSMLHSLGLDTKKFNRAEVDHILLKFFTHEYRPDGQGSLFYIPGFTGDMRYMQLWDQANRWLIWINNSQMEVKNYD